MTEAVKLTPLQSALLKEMVRDGNIAGFLSRSEMSVCAALSRQGLAWRVDSDLPNHWQATDAGRAAIAAEISR